MSSTLSSPPALAAAAAHDDGSPADTATLAAHQPGPVISEPLSTATDRPTSDPFPSPSQEASRIESGADDPTSVIDPAASRQLPSDHVGKTKEEEDKLDRFSCHIWCVPPSRISHRVREPDTAPNRSLEVPDEPVVSPCGHLYCWPCMHEVRSLERSYKALSRRNKLMFISLWHSGSWSRTVAPAQSAKPSSPSTNSSPSTPRPKPSIRGEPSLLNPLPSVPRSLLFPEHIYALGRKG